MGSILPKNGASIKPRAVQSLAPDQTTELKFAFANLNSARTGEPHGFQPCAVDLDRAWERRLESTHVMAAANELGSLRRTASGGGMFRGCFGAWTASFDGERVRARDGNKESLVGTKPHEALLRRPLCSNHSSTCEEPEYGQ